MENIKNILANGKAMKCVALGEDVVEEVEVVNNNPPVTVDEKLMWLEQRLKFITSSMDSLFAMIKDLRAKIDRKADNKIAVAIEKDKSQLAIPEGTILNGTTNNLSYFCKVTNGGFYIGSTRYESLSAAAKEVSGVRRSGWTFWHLPDGRSVKEVFKS